MSRRMGGPSEEEIQRQYYSETAADYDGSHIESHDKYIALNHILTFMQLHGINSMLDIGCGTGRGVSFFLRAMPECRVHGSEPSLPLLREAVNKGLGRRQLSCSSGLNLPFKDGAFDAVCSLGVLHHVRNPELVVSEMLRVASKAVFIADANRFGQGSGLARVLKWVFWACGLWPAANWFKTRGRGYTISEGDGLAYSYSVYDSYSTLVKGAKGIVMIPTTPTRPRTGISWFDYPLLTSNHMLVCAFKEEATLS